MGFGPAGVVFEAEASDPLEELFPVLEFHAPLLDFKFRGSSMPSEVVDKLRRWLGADTSLLRGGLFDLFEVLLPKAPWGCLGY